jgi:hypothetical protein
MGFISIMKGQLRRSRANIYGGAGVEKYYVGTAKAKQGENVRERWIFTAFLLKDKK